MAYNTGLYQVSPRTLADGEQTALRVDATGALVTTSAGGGANSTYSTPKGYQQISSDQLATAQAMNVPNGAMRAVVQNNGAQAARFRNDGGAPTATVGQRIPGGDSIDVTTSLSAYRFIREAEGVQLDIIFYG